MHNIPESLSFLESVRHKDKDLRGAHISYVTRTKSLSSTLSLLLEKHASEYVIEYTKEMRDCLIDPSLFFPSPTNELIIEIGFGSGEASLQIARSNPSINYLCFDVFLYGFACFLEKIVENNLQNVRLVRYDAQDFIRHSIRDESVSGFNIFFPDPWIKKKQKKRRIMNPCFSAVLASKLKNGGFIHFASDIEEYAKEVLAILSNIPTLHNPFENFAPPLYERFCTKYEQKAKTEGRKSFDVYFIKNS